MYGSVTPPIPPSTKTEEYKSVDIMSKDGRTLVFRTTEEERGRVIFQIGSSNAETAVAAASVVQEDVAAICVNMGCPKRFSMQVSR